MPERPQLVARRGFQLGFDLMPFRLAVIANEAFRSLIRNSLIADNIDQPIIYLGSRNLIAVR